MRHYQKRRGVSEIIGVLLMLAIVVTLGVLTFASASGGMGSLSENYAAAMSKRENAASEKFAVEQVAFTFPGAMAPDGTSTNEVVGSSGSIAASLTTTNANDLIVAYVSPADTGSATPPSVSGISGGGLTWSHRVSTPTETYTEHYVPVTITNNLGSAPALDGKGYTTQGTPAATIAATLSTISPEDVVIAIVSGQNTATGTFETPSASDSAALNWHARSTLQEVAAAGGYSFFTEIFYAVAASPLSSDSITITWNSAPTHYAVLQVFGVSGANTASPFDPHAGLPNFATGAYASVTTSNANDFIYGFEATAVTASPTAGSGFTGIESGVGGAFASEYKTVSAAQAGLSMTYSNAASDTDGAWGDAIEAAPSTATPNPFQQKVTWVPTTYATYEASDLGNIRFCSDDACATPLYAWLDSCSGTCGMGATSASAWVKLTSSIAGSGGTLTIYMVFMSSTTEFDGVYWGEAPNLSASYGLYDNGANVFTQYGGKSWGGFTTVEGTWSSATGPLQETATTGSYAAGPAALIEGTSYAATGAYVLDTAFQYTTEAVARVGLAAVVGVNTGDPQGYRFIGQQANNGAGFISFLNDQVVWEVSNAYPGATSTSYTMEVVDNVGTWSGSFYSGYGTTGATLTTLAATPYSTNNNVGSATGYVGVSAGYYTGTTVQANPATFQWFAMRALPPSGVMPSASLGSTSSTAATFDVEEWYAAAASPLSSATITASLSGTGDTAATWIAVFGISGANTINPFDTNPSLPATSAAASPSTTMSTSNPSDMLLYACAAGAGGVATGFTSIYSNTYPPDQNEYVGYEGVSSIQTNLATSCGSNSFGAEITDAVVASSGPDIYVRNVGTAPTTLVSVYITDATADAFVSQTTISITVNVGTFADIPHNSIAFVPSHGHTYSFTVSSSLGNSVIYNVEAT